MISTSLCYSPTVASGKLPYFFLMLTEVMFDSALTVENLERNMWTVCRKRTELSGKYF
jgi:hypothetical protein